MKFVQSTLAAILVLFSCFGAAATATAQYEVLYTFPSSSKPLTGYDSGNLRIDTQGNLFGDLLNGTDFELSPGVDGFTEKPLPVGPGGADWIADAKGNYYRALEGNYVNGILSPGEIIEVSPLAGGGFHQKTIYTFGAYSSDGLQPTGSLVFDVEGNLYGTTTQGGASGTGSVFELIPAANGKWNDRVLYSFGLCCYDGYSPDTGLTIDSAGNLYGVTAHGGSSVSCYNMLSCCPEFLCDYYFDGGTVFELTHQSSGDWKKTIIYYFDPPVDFEGNPANVGGANPVTGLILDNQGNLYGVDENGGGTSHTPEGAIFKLSPVVGGGWSAKFVSIDCDGGCTVFDTPALDVAGNLYDATSGGIGTGSTIFKVTPQFDYSELDYSVLHYFGSESPSGGVALSHGNLYGVTSDNAGKTGAVYELHGVAPSAPVETATSISASPGTNLVAGEPITLTATVTAASGLLIPTGTVTFVDPAGGSTKALLVAGKAVYSGKVPPMGSYSVYASYSGDTSFAASKSVTIAAAVSAP